MNGNTVFWTPGVTLGEMEKMVVKAALKVYQGAKGDTALALGISERTLYNLCQRYEKEDAEASERKKADDVKRAAFLRAQGYRGDLSHLENVRPIKEKVDKYASIDEEFSEDQKPVPPPAKIEVTEEPAKSKKREKPA